MSAPAAFEWTPRLRAMAAREYLRRCQFYTRRVLEELDTHERIGIDATGRHAAVALAAAGTSAYLLEQRAIDMRRVLEPDGPGSLLP